MTRMPHITGWNKPPDDPRAPAEPGPESEVALVQLEPEEPCPARAGRRSFRDKLLASLRGLKLALRGDSSFFAHAYRFILIALAAARLGVDANGWCLLVITAAFVLMAELTHSAIDTLARAVGDPEEPRLKAAREIATGGVLVAVGTWATIAVVVLTLKLGDLLGWWG